MNHVFPEFSSPLGYMRARACWMVQYFSEIAFTDDNHLQYALQQVRQGEGGRGGRRKEGGREGGREGREGVTARERVSLHSMYMYMYR